MSRTIVKAGLLISAGIFAGRVAGFVRESVIAANFGVSESADIAVLMLTVPDLIVNILIGGALSVALIPEFKRLGVVKRGSLFLQTSALVGGIFTVVAAVLVSIAGPLVQLVAPGFSPALTAAAAEHMRVVLWVIPLSTLAGVSAAYLHAHERFAVVSLGTLVFNLTVIAGLVLFVGIGEPGVALEALAGFILLGASIRWFSQLVSLPRLILSWRCFRLKLISRTLLVRYLQALMAGSLLLFLPFVARALASYYGTGSLALFNYASKLIEFPLGVSITVISILLFPRLSQHFAKKETLAEGQKVLREGVAVVLLLALSIMISMIAFRASLTQLAFGSGRMYAPALEQISTLVAIGLLSLPAQGISSVLVAAFNAQNNTRTPLCINAAGLVSFVVFGVVGFRFLGLEGIMIALAVNYYAIMLVQVMVLKQQTGLETRELFLNVDTLRLAATIGFFALPIVAMTSLVSTNAVGGTLLAGICFAILVLAGVLSHRSYRSVLIRRCNRLWSRSYS